MARAGHLTRRVSLYAVLAAACGLIVWIATVWRVAGIWAPGGQALPIGEYDTPKLLTVLLIYGPFGALLGALVAMLEPIQDSSFKDALRNEARWLYVGLGLGFVGAVAGGLVGERVLSAIYEQRHATSHMEAIDQGRFLGTVLVGLILGGCLGLIDRLRSASNERFIAGFAGGAVGGLLAAVLFRFVISVESLTVLSLIVLGACTAGAIGSITFLQTRAFLFGMKGNISKYGPRKLVKKLMSDAPNRIGSALLGKQSSSTTFKIVHDLNVMPEHAEILCSQRHRLWTLRRLSADATELFLNGRRLLNDPVPLKDGDVIALGGTHFQFRTKL